MQRKSGVLMHISSLYGEYSIGSFGQNAREFIDFLSDCGFSYWQVLPFGLVDAHNSPYQSYSAFGGNPYFVDLELLCRRGLLSAEELNEARQENPYVCEYVRLYHTRVNLLAKAANRFPDKSVIEAYIHAHPHLEAFCEFMGRKAANSQVPWYEWETDAVNEETVFTWKFIQYEFFRQWAEIKAYANGKGIHLIGDIPVYVALDSCDVWSNREQYCLDSDGRPLKVAGVPPDYFCEDGQLWGNPLYNWEKMKQDGYQWWCDRIRHMAELFDAVRIDHFRGLESYWAVPASAATAKEGHWEKGPGMELISALKAAAGDSEIIAEDLGDITPEVEQLVKDSGFPGMRVFQFGFLGDEDNLHRPHHYPKNSVTYSGTHDNNTLLGYLWELDGAHREKMLSYCGHRGSWESGCESILRTLLSSHADLVLFPIQDLLGFGSDTRLNIPGKADGNWQFRITAEQLRRIDRKYWYEQNRLYARI